MAKIDTIIKIAGTGTVAVTTDGVASIDVPEDGEIVAIAGVVYGTGMADDDRAMAEISFLSTSQFGVNDARGAIVGLVVQVGVVTTSGQAQAQDSGVIVFGGAGIPVNAGERIHLHTSATTGVIPSATFMLYMTTTGGGRRSRKTR